MSPRSFKGKKFKDVGEAVSVIRNYGHAETYLGLRAGMTKRCLRIEDFILSGDYQVNIRLSLSV